ncbi:diguanylate cyclase, partial [bacterium LRH843]|nr:diguanylate cyclase [bacterium LRH843]
TLSIAKRIANRLVKRVEEETIPKTTISSGISFWSQEQQDSTEKLFKRADLALYEAKKRGKNQAVIQEYK